MSLLQTGSVHNCLYSPRVHSVRYTPVLNTQLLLGRVLGHDWRVLGHDWRVLGHDWRVLGHDWRVLGHDWRVLGQRFTALIGRCLGAEPKLHFFFTQIA